MFNGLAGTAIAFCSSSTTRFSSIITFGEIVVIVGAVVGATASIKVITAAEVVKCLCSNQQKRLKQKYNSSKCSSNSNN